MLSSSEFNELKRNLIEQGKLDDLLRLLDNISVALPQTGAPAPMNVHNQAAIVDIDPQTGEPTTRISANYMVEAYLGHGYQIVTNVENWRPDRFVSDLANEKEIQMAIHLRNKRTGEITTLREQFNKFPSADMRAKLSLMNEDDPR